ncbi:hypothetical protein CVT25_014262 [Psilocybe cyanescens]|uniref:Uncharacterized protein n=1 Tax=Psilocybe cyanescens TaxID=93625 RepID=A0A409VPF0_PSICY|nr:hypothetical protein CVT25_014262 [Psilocybe cyanescens]
MARLAKKEAISSSDELWLDNEANIIDKERILEALESASDYEHRVARLMMTLLLAKLKHS